MIVTKIRNKVNNKDYFSKIDCPKKAYCLGLLMSDGTVSRSNRIEITQKANRASVLNFLAEEIGFVGYYRINDVKGCKYPVLGFTDKKMASDLKRHGMAPSKTYTCRFNNIEESLKPALLLGWFDGDGCISYTSARHTVFQISGTRDSVLDIYQYLHSLGIKVSYRKHNSSTDSKTYIVYAYRKDTIKQIYNLLYRYDFCLQSKKKVFEQILNDYNLIGTSETWFDEETKSVEKNRYINNKHEFNSILIGMIIGSSSFLGPNRFRIHKGKNCISDVKKKVALLSDYIQTKIYKETEVNNTIQAYAHYNHKKYFKYLYSEMIVDGKVRLTSSIINRIDTWSLFFIYNDKGKIDKNNLYINFRKFSKHECQMFCDYLKKKYGIVMKPVKKSGYYVLISDNKNKTLFLNLIKYPEAVYDNIKPLQLPTSDKEPMMIES